ncbi:hypothetical protein DLJ53_25795 [Acuticoccus sediminis]|uniref:Uncharacterized protein n=1 Tax=Acuticoccus sediminis TaxID=2184697 RepID=A0A8B2NN30_9HYPH|nr:hypothetical protein [Acuticoccus sediminis]RAH98137.1 hypothetical protein DLJ53_25795 [Acuticoccus sediminis]
MRRTHDYRLIRFLAGHAAVGALIAVAAVSLLVIGDVGGLRGLVMRNDAGYLALAVMLGFFVITFASVQMSVALMLHTGEEPAGRKDRDVPAGMKLQPIRITARDHRPTRRY